MGKVGQRKGASLLSYPAQGLHHSRSFAPEGDIYINLEAVRKCVCIRIVNTFLDGGQTAYTIWVSDLESGREWYAPVRYFQDFLDLRDVTNCEATADLPFPFKRWGVLPSIGSRDVSSPWKSKDPRCNQLEQFLRGLSAMVYRGPLHPKIAEVAFHLQSFLGCDACYEAEENLALHHQVAVSEASYWRKEFLEGHNEAQTETRLHLKQALQRYVYRIFLLPVLEQLTSRFIEEVQKQAPSIEEMKTLEKKGRTSLKDAALQNLEKLQGFLDQLQDLLLEGCEEDMRSISDHSDFSTLKNFMTPGADNSYRATLYMEAIREQVEIEAYVPLRSVMSRQLVNGWRHDDMEMQFKMQELQKRPQSYFKINPKHQSPTDWCSVSKILREGVGHSTLPCVKLRAIVDAAKEISRLYIEEHSQSQSQHESSGNHDKKPGTHDGREVLGADDFLPIFIFCIVRAEIERPSALCVLLQTLCHPSKRNGETGYFLASFEAAIEHIREIDLKEYYNDFAFI